MAFGQRLILREAVNTKYWPGEPHRDELTLRKGAEFVVLEPPDNDHPDACLVEAAGAVWGWLPLRCLARLEAE